MSSTKSVRVDCNWPMSKQFIGSLLEFQAPGNGLLTVSVKKRSENFLSIFRRLLGLSKCNPLCKFSLFQMCPRENAEHGISNYEDLTTVTRKVTKIEESLVWCS